MNKNLIFFALISLVYSSCSKKTTGLPWNHRHKEKLEIREVDFNYLAGKAKIKFKDDEYDIKAKANIRIKKDSIIWMNFEAVGIQGGRCAITNDSIVILNMLKKEYYIFQYEELSERFNFNVNFDIIQSAALGNLLHEEDSRDELISKENFYVLKQEDNTLSIDNYINRKNSKIVKVDVKESSSNNTVAINYSNFQLLEDHNMAFPYSGFISLIYSTAKGNVNTIIDIEYNKVEIGDKPLKFPFNISKKYERR